MAALTEDTLPVITPQIAELEFSALQDRDLMNLILQRSEVIYEQSKRNDAIRAWRQGNDAPINVQVKQLGHDIARRAAAVVYEEYQELADTLATLKPKRVADIGCGYALFDLFLAKTLDVDLLLIDLEENETRHFGFKNEGSAYSSLSVARKLLESNGIKPAKIETLNPGEIKPENANPVDLVVSFISCGFHYPVDLYIPFLENVLSPGGAAIFDLRKKTADAQSQTLSALGQVTELPSQKENVRRVLLRKA